ncbi:MAG TPA: flagellar biosynthesis protein FlhA [Bryobacteraceae bacterium]|nr:flagellar biosynthesis protein FlhA [Bryobacteraceae bacterium]
MAHASLAVPKPNGSTLPQTLSQVFGEMGVPIAVVGIVIALITPMPGALLDFLLVVDIMLSVIVMMVAIYVRRAVDFSVFPTTLLLLTLYRLALNISSARLILLNGNTGTSAAGHVIEAFGSFVVGGNYVIGAVIFLVLIAIQYVVINHGAVRISEVTARFTLDAMPGKQMSIDADMNAGLIDEAEARSRRKQLVAEAEFYGAMDGASRFTQRDAIASILITAINIIAGFLIGVFQHGMELKRALETYTVLTIGDGLVTVIPALMISISGGLIITRTSSDDSLGAEFKKQVLGNAQPLMLASGVLGALSLFPGLPTIPFLALGGGLGVIGWRMRQKSVAAAAVSTAKAAKPKENNDALVKIEPLAIEVGMGLVKLVEAGPESPLLQRVGGIRRQLAGQLGYLMPPVKVKDNLNLRTRQYTVQLRGVEIAQFELMQGHELAIPGGAPDPSLQGKPAQDPAFGLPALWIRPDQVDRARASGYTVVDAVSIIGTHLTELVRKFASELFTRQEAKNFCDRVAQDNPKVVEDLVPKLLPLVTIQRVLQNMLRERIPIRDAVGILEALGEAAQTTKNSVLLTEFVRQSIRRSIVKPHLNSQGELPAYFLDPSMERPIEQAVEHSELNSILTLSPEAIRDICARIERRVDKLQAGVVVTSFAARHFLRQMVEAALPNLTVLSHNEIPQEVRVRSLGVID